MLFLYHIRHLNPVKIHHERKIKSDKTWLMILIMKALNFLSLKQILRRLKIKIIFALRCFVMKRKNLVYPVFVLNEKFENCTDLFMITDENKSHYV